MYRYRYSTREGKSFCGDRDHAVVELSREFEPTGRRFDPRRETRGLGSDTSDDHAAAPALAAPAFADPASATPARFDDFSDEDKRP